MGAGSCSCVVFLGAYSTVVLLAFIVVTVLYSTHGSMDCSDTISGAHTQVKRLVHVDFLNMDKSLNTDGDITDKQEVATEEDQHIVGCNYGEEAVFTLLECLVRVSIFVSFIYMCCGACGQLRTVYLKRHKRSLKKREKKVANLMSLGWVGV